MFNTPNVGNFFFSGRVDKIDRLGPGIVEEVHGEGVQSRLYSFAEVGMRILFGFQIGNMTMAFVKVAKIPGFSLSTRMYIVLNKDFCKKKKLFFLYNFWKRSGVSE